MKMWLIVVLIIFLLAVVNGYVPWLNSSTPKVISIFGAVIVLRELLR